jgi:hypothetical protein
MLRYIISWFGFASGRGADFDWEEVFDSPPPNVPRSAVRSPAPFPIWRGFWDFSAGFFMIQTPVSIGKNV